MNSCSRTSRRPSEAGNDCGLGRLNTNSSSVIVVSHSVALDASLRSFRSVRSERSCWCRGGSKVGLSNRCSFIWFGRQEVATRKSRSRSSVERSPRSKRGLAGPVSSRLKVRLELVGSSAIPVQTVHERCRYRSNQYRVRATDRRHIKTQPFPESTMMVWKTSCLAIL